jgi:vacuolar-type H+-ATPase subunit F/Vma7
MSTRAADLPAAARAGALPVFLGDELSAAGFRLGGIEARTPPPGEELAFFERARREAPLLLLTAALAARLPAELLAAVQHAGRPLVVIVPDVRRRTAPLDLVRALRRQLGMEA